MFTKGVQSNPTGRRSEIQKKADAWDVLRPQALLHFRRILSGENRKATVSEITAVAKIVIEMTDGKPKQNVKIDATLITSSEAHIATLHKLSLEHVASMVDVTPAAEAEPAYDIKAEPASAIIEEKIVDMTRDVADLDAPILPDADRGSGEAMPDQPVDVPGDTPMPAGEPRAVPDGVIEGDDWVVTNIIDAVVSEAELGDDETDSLSEDELQGMSGVALAGQDAVDPPAMGDHLGARSRTWVPSPAPLYFPPDTSVPQSSILSGGAQRLSLCPELSSAPRAPPLPRAVKAQTSSKSTPWYGQPLPRKGK